MTVSVIGTQLSAAAFVPTGSTPPTTGMYLPVAGTIGIVSATATGGVWIGPGASTSGGISLGIGTDPTGELSAGSVLEAEMNWNGETAIIIRNRQVGIHNAVGINFANDSDDMDYQIFVNGGINGGAGVARSANHVVNAGDWVLWASYVTPRQLIRATNAGRVSIGAVTNPLFKLHVTSSDDYLMPFLAAGNSMGVRIWAGATGSSIQGVDHTGVASFQPLDVNGSAVTLSTQGVQRLKIDGSGHVSISNLPTSSAGLTAGTLWNNSGTVMVV